jgi:hypothetical protein
MFFGKKNKEIKCESCEKSVDKKFSFCPYCGESLLSDEDLEDYGMLGKDDSEELSPLASMGFTDKILNSLMNNVMKSIDKQMKESMRLDGKPEIRTLPNGIAIRVGNVPLNFQNKAPEKKSPNLPKITDEQIERISKLPRAEAKTHAKRLANKLIYELTTPGVKDIKDVLVSKLESGYEIKAIGEKKVYVNSIPVNLPLKQITLEKNKLLAEFLPNQQ